MKKLVLLAVTAAALVLAAGKAEASSGTNLVLNISGSVQYMTTNSATTNSVVGKTKTLSFNNATIYNLISNAVANAANGLATNLPAKGIIEYDAIDTDGNNNGNNIGFFYVTDKANDFFYQLSGFDESDNYYSFMELDSWVIGADDSIIHLGFSQPFDGSSSYSINKSGNGSLSGKSTALLYIHDDPYLFDAADDPNTFYDNDSIEDNSNTEAIEIQGILTVHLTYKTNSISGGTLSLTGTGNTFVPNASPTDQASVISGHASIQ